MAQTEPWIYASLLGTIMILLPDWCKACFWPERRQVCVRIIGELKREVGGVL